MNHLSVGFDVDDVLLPSGSHMIRWYNHHFGTHLTTEHWYKNDPVEPWAVASEQEIIERINTILNSDDYLSDIEPIEGAARVLDDIDAAGDHRFAVTSRPPFLAEMTHKALELCYPGMFPAGTVNFINHSTAVAAVNKLEKVEVALEQKATHFVDDFEQHLRPMAAAGIIPLLFGEYHHNRTTTTPGLERVPDMNALRERLRYERTK